MPSARFETIGPLPLIIGRTGPLVKYLQAVPCSGAHPFLKARYLTTILPSSMFIPHT